MPTNLVLCVKNAVDFATITGNPAMVPTLPPSNLKLSPRGLTARTTSTATQELLITWGGQGWYLNFLKLARINFEAGATWRVQIYSDPAWTTQIYDTGVLPSYDYLTLGELDFGVSPLGAGVFDGFLGQMYSLVYFPRVLAVSVKITVTNPGNSAGYMEASRLFAGDYHEFAWNPESATFAWDELTEQSRSLGGSLRSDGDIVYRSLELQLTLKDEVQRAKLADMLRYAGLRKDVFLSLWPGAGGERERDYTMIAKFFGKLPRLDLASGSDTQKTRLSFQEV